MNVLCTMPGRFGDLLWALPTVRALSLAYAAPVDLLISGKYQAILPLLVAQPYIGMVSWSAEWVVQETAPMTPRVPPAEVLADRSARYGPYHAVYHLGYETWPEGTLAEDIYRRTQAVTETSTFLPPLDLDRPWIRPRSTLPPPPAPMSEVALGPSGEYRARVCLGWSEEHFELKVGLSVLLAARFPLVEFWWIRPWGGRYDEIDASVRDLPANLHLVRADWLQTADFVSWAQVYVGCLSAAWVLANALGKPAIVCEPNPQRHHPVFWCDRPRNILVRGIDGLPTFDARHVGDALAAHLHVAGRERVALAVGEREHPRPRPDLRLTLELGDGE